MLKQGLKYIISTLIMYVMLSLFKSNNGFEATVMFIGASLMSMHIVKDIFSHKK